MFCTDHFIVKCICLKDLKVLQYSLTFQKRIAFPEVVSQGCHSCIDFLKNIYLCFQFITFGHERRDCFLNLQGYNLRKGFPMGFLLSPQDKRKSGACLFANFTPTFFFNFSYLNVSTFFLSKVEILNIQDKLSQQSATHCFSFILSLATFYSIRVGCLLVLVSYLATILYFLTR